MRGLGDGQKLTGRRRLCALLVAAAVAFVPAASYGNSTYNPILTGIGNPGDPSTYGALVMPPNDDGSSNWLQLPFGVDFYGSVFDRFYINNNGNLTFNSPVWSWTPSPFPVANQPMIAPYWADVDTGAGPGSDGSNQVYLAAPNPQTVVVTWDRVGYYWQNMDKVNTFQVVLRDRWADTGHVGDFDVEFRYGQLQWTTGDASGGTGGLGGTPAQAGFDAGDGTNYMILPGSFTAAVLELANTSNVSSETPGLWSFAVRGSTPPGATPQNPLMPVVVDEGFDFEFGIGQIGQMVFIDPLVAIGYDYVINSGPWFQTVTLPTLGFGDNLYDIYLGSLLVQSNWPAGSAYDFGSSGVSAFRVMGIELPGLDPTDPTAFVTGLTFTGTGTVNMTMTAVTVDTTVIPEPITATALVLALGGLGGYIRRRRLA